MHLTNAIIRVHKTIVYNIIMYIITLYVLSYLSHDCHMTFRFFGEEPPPPPSQITWKVDKKEVEHRLSPTHPNLLIIFSSSLHSLPFSCWTLRPRLLKTMQLGPFSFVVLSSPNLYVNFKLH